MAAEQERAVYDDLRRLAARLQAMGLDDLAAFRREAGG